MLSAKHLLKCNRPKQSFSSNNAISISKTGTPYESNSFSPPARPRALRWAQPPQASPQGVPPAAAPPPLPGRSPDPAPTSPQGVAAAAGSREEALRGWREAPGDAARLGPAAARGNSKGSRPHSLCRTGARIGAAAPAPHYLLRAAAAGGRRDRSGPCSPGSEDEEAATAAAAKDNQEPAGSAPPRRAQNARAQREPGPHLQPASNRLGPLPRKGGATAGGAGWGGTITPAGPELLRRFVRRACL
ncbi:atherin-like [Acinonyx jubatus]|uniref:Atherin-like n=1 Tax=Acinonyx jubatus TaxID=32536 RepID=A0ABM3N829_ACIJB|nr:atherin-like [Acinonyx jubatus]